MILQVDTIHTFYGTSHVLFGVSLNLKEGDLVCLLGRNGAGKTTTFLSIMGLCPISSGKIEFMGIEINRNASYQRARMGIAMVFQGNPVFPDLTVHENLEVAFRHGKAGGEEWDMDRVYHLFPKLRELGNKQAKNLSGGERQMLSIGRAQMGNPRLLLLDEPTEGLAPLVVAFLKEQIEKLHQDGVTILLAEQNVEWALGFTEYCYVLEKGQISFQGTSDELNQCPDVKRQMLGVG